MCQSQRNSQKILKRWQGDYNQWHWRTQREGESKTDTALQDPDTLLPSSDKPRAATPFQDPQNVDSLWDLTTENRDKRRAFYKGSTSTPTDGFSEEDTD
jgi:hypothetical protein